MPPGSGGTRGDPVGTEPPAGTIPPPRRRAGPSRPHRRPPRKVRHVDPVYPELARRRASPASSSRERHRPRGRGAHASRPSAAPPLLDARHGGRRRAVDVPADAAQRRCRSEVVMTVTVHCQAVSMIEVLDVPALRHERRPRPAFLSCEATLLLMSVASDAIAIRNGPGRSARRSSGRGAAPVRLRPLIRSGEPAQCARRRRALAGAIARRSRTSWLARVAEWSTWPDGDATARWPPRARRRRSPRR